MSLDQREILEKMKNTNRICRSQRYRTWLTVVCCLVAVSLFAASGRAGQAAVATGSPISSGCEYDYPPFSIVDANGRAGGFAVELMRAAVQAMGRQVAFRTGPWTEVKGWLEQGVVEALPLVGRTPEREAVFDFTFPYMSLHGAIVVREGSKGINDLKDLRGRRVAVMKGDNAEEFLRRAERGIEIHTTATFQDALLELSRGRHDAVVIQRLVALRLIKETGLTNLRVVNKPIDGFRQDFSFAVKEGDKDTLALLNEGLALVIADGTYRRLHAKWFAALELPPERRIVIGGDHNYPPYEYLDEQGRPAGYNVELTRSIAREMGVDIEIRLGPWTEILKGLEDGEIDAVQGVFYSPERDGIFDFTQAHTANHCVGVVRKGSGAPPSSVDELAGKSIVVQQGDIMHDFALQNGLGEHLKVVGSQEDALEEVVEGRYDCALVARMSALYWIEKHGWTDLAIGRRSLLSPEYCYAVRNNQKALLAQLSEGLKVIDENGEYRRIHKKWLGVYENLAPSLTTVFRYVALIAAPLLLVLLAFFVWSWSLRKQVASRTSELKESESLLETIIDSIAAPVFYKNAKGVYLGCNQAFSHFIGLPKELIVGRTAPEIAPGGLAQPFLDDDSVLLHEGIVQAYETEVEHKSGARRQVMLQKSSFRGPDGLVKGIVGAMLDITDRKRAEESLREREAFIRTVLDNLPVGIAVNSVYPVVEFQYMNDNFPRFYRTTREALANPDLFWDAVYEDPEVRDQMKKRVLEDCASGDPDRMYWVDVPITRKGDKTAFITSRNLPIPDKQLMISTVWDVTERKLAEQRIEHLNRVLRGIRDVNQLIIRERDRDKLIREGCRLLVDNRGYTSALIVLTDEKDRPVSWAGAGMAASFDMLPALDRETLPPCCGFARPVDGVVLIEDREGICGPCPVAKGCADADSLCVRLIHGSKAFGYLAVAVEHGLGADAEELSLLAEMAGDLAYSLYAMQTEEARERSERERKALGEQLVQAQKLESIGRLAGGVAHDFNNMLGVIIGYAEMALDEVGAADPLRVYLDEIFKAARRSSDISRQLLAFARKQTISPKVLDVNETVEGMLKMLRRLIGEDIDLAWLPKADLWKVSMDPSQIDQILANLCVNARDAISGVGKVTIETGKVSFDEAYCSVHAGFVPGEFVLLAVSDSGCGMDKETLANIFEPFFTTKGIEQGTGLGLATVYGIVKQNNGFINVYSEPGKGTSIKIYLPRHIGEPAEEKAAGEPEIPHGRNETILLVDDERAMLDMARKMLERLGYRVLAAGTPGEAIGLAQDHSGRIDLLITDVVMPEMNGRDMSERLQSFHPNLKTLFMSGYTANVIAHRGVLDEGMHFIQKPLSMKGLALRVRDLLDHYVRDDD